MKYQFYHFILPCCATHGGVAARRACAKQNSRCLVIISGYLKLQGEEICYPTHYILSFYRIVSGLAMLASAREAVQHMPNMHVKEFKTDLPLQLKGWRNINGGVVAVSLPYIWECYGLLIFQHPFCCYRTFDKSYRYCCYYFTLFVALFIITEV